MIVNFKNKKLKKVKPLFAFVMPDFILKRSFKNIEDKKKFIKDFLEINNEVVLITLKGGESCVILDATEKEIDKNTIFDLYKKKEDKKILNCILYEKFSVFKLLNELTEIYDKGIKGVIKR